MTTHTKLKIHLAMIGGILMLNSRLAQWFFYRDEPFISDMTMVLGSLIVALPIFFAAVGDMKQGKFYMNGLVAVALTAAFVAGNYIEAGVIAFFMLIAITVEESTAIGARTSIEGLIKLTPTRIRRIDMTNGEEKETVLEELHVNDVIRIRPGENFPADGVVTRGASIVNQASITGESLPADKDKDDTVFAGTENLTGSLDVKVTKIGKDTTLGKVRDLIEAAQKTRPPILRIADEYVFYYAPSIMLIAGIVWFFSQDMMNVVLVLVIACPCALVVATPSAVVAAIAGAARQGILIKNVGLIETVAEADTIVFDKTGTLTEGKLEVARLNPAAGVSLTDLVKVAVSTESQSNHPTANAVRQLAEEATVNISLPERFTEIPGKGVEAEFEDGIYRLGCGVWFEEIDLNIAKFKNAIAEDEEVADMSIVYVAKNNDVLGWIGLRDAIRSNARDTVTKLNSLGISNCCMITGDNESVATAIARQSGITNIKSQCLPEAKAYYVNDLKQTGKSVIVVGDGVNDAPALAAGDIGIAMGAAGSDIAVNSASVALMSNNLMNVPFLIELSRKTRLVMNMNLLFGTTIILGGLMFIIFGNHVLDDLARFCKIKPSIFKASLAAGIHIAGTATVLFNSAGLVRFSDRTGKRDH